MVFSEKLFQVFSTLIHDQFGIYISPIKKGMLQAKLNSLMRRHQLADYMDLYRLLTGPTKGEHLKDLAEVITTNKTEFFREVSHFDFIRQRLPYILNQNPRIQRDQEIRAWSAGCSTGEEPYTLAMVLLESVPTDVRIRIMATDINCQVLSKAQQGLYPADLQNKIDRYLLSKYFHRVENGLQVNDVLRRLVSFRLFNLMNRFPFRNPVDMIFCRNVMIYFDLPVQEALLAKFYEVLSPGGLLFIGHSESLSNRRHSFKYVQPTIYIKQ